MSARATRVGFGIGAVGKDLAYALVSGFILYYYNTVLGVSGTFLGIVMMAARIFDAIDDPIMGVIVSKTRTRWGRFRPWILAGTLTNALVLYAVFAVPPSLEGTPVLVWMAVAYFLWGITYTLMDIPFWSLIPAVTTAGSARERLVVIGRACSAIGGFLPAAITMLVVTRIEGGPRVGFMVVAAVVAALFVIAELIAVLLVREDPKVVATVAAEKSPTVRQMLGALVKNDQAMVVVIGFVIFSTAQYLTGQLAVYFFSFDIRNSDVLTVFAIVGVGAQIIAMLCFPLLRKRWSGMAVFTAAIATMVAGYLLLFLLATFELHGVLELAAAAFVLYAGAGLISVLTTVFLADSVDYGEWKHGARNEAVVFSMQTFVAKLASALAVLVAGIGIDVIGLQPDADAQSASTLVGLRVLMFIIPVVILLVSLVFLRRTYRLGDDTMAQITDALAVVRGADAAPQSTNDEGAAMTDGEGGQGDAPDHSTRD